MASQAPLQRTPPEWTLGERIRKVRREVKMKQEDFATLIGVGSKALASWELDNRKPEDLLRVARSIEKRTGFPAAWVLLGDDPMNAPEPPALVDATESRLGESNSRPIHYKMPPLRLAS